jgi:hypothetical protein
VQQSEKPKPVTYLVAKGMLRCSDCFASPEINADGRDQKVHETSYWDTVSARIVDAYTVEIIAKKAGKTMYTEIDTVSPDGRTLTQVVKDTCHPHQLVALCWLYGCRQLPDHAV